MFVIFNNSTAVACFEELEVAVEYWHVNGGTIIFYPDLGPDDIHLYRKG